MFCVLYFSFFFFFTLTPKTQTYAHTSICIFRWLLKYESRVRNIAKDSSKTAGTEETPFFDKATHKYCLMALINMPWVRKTGPAFWRHDKSSSKERIFDLSSWDLQNKDTSKCQWLVFILVLIQLLSQLTLFQVIPSHHNQWHIGLKSPGQMISSHPASLHPTHLDSTHVRQFTPTHLIHLTHQTYQISRFSICLTLVHRAKPYYPQMTSSYPPLINLISPPPARLTSTHRP